MKDELHNLRNLFKPRHSRTPQPKTPPKPKEQPPRELRACLSSLRGHVMADKFIQAYIGVQEGDYVLITNLEDTARIIRPVCSIPKALAIMLQLQELPPTIYLHPEDVHILQLNTETVIAQLSHEHISMP